MATPIEVSSQNSKFQKLAMLLEKRWHSVSKSSGFKTETALLKALMELALEQVKN